ncbi:hypothetical protein LTR62_008489 [Meristemomyces frigidus]|uniref:Uncharacterized protein n=1 Tax=Meristemomyces frigidus TaxID=1508187 RepID=A0AAN7YSY4_9PEZI|nr:hypothetical protein LTR62_008489 [Meristemomyces frigidus]
MDWGTESIGSFMTKHHNDIQPAIDPGTVTQPRPFIVCIVGAFRSIGAGIAHAYANAEANDLVLAARRISGLEQTAAQCKQINPNIDRKVFECVISSSDSVKAIAETTSAHFGRLDVLVINSGSSGHVVLDLTADDPEELINASNVNYFGTFLGVKYFVPLL